MYTRNSINQDFKKAIVLLYVFHKNINYGITISYSPQLHIVIVHTNLNFPSNVHQISVVCRQKYMIGLYSILSSFNKFPLVSEIINTSKTLTGITSVTDLLPLCHQTYCLFRLGLRCCHGNQPYVTS